jgi:hypothetical protein
MGRSLERLLSTDYSTGEDAEKAASSLAAGFRTGFGFGLSNSTAYGSTKSGSIWGGVVVFNLDL